MNALIGTATAAPLVRVENLSVGIRGRGGAQILDSVSFEVNPGRITALVGESGAGKSMTTKAILGALDERIFTVSGDIEVCGEDVEALTARARRRYLSSVSALVFQNPTRALNPTMRVGPQIAEAMRFSPSGPRLSREAARERAVELMRQVGIAAPEERYHAYPHQMSGGMKQRAVIAIALSLNPKVLFCDEPTSSLDVTTQALIMDLLDELRERLGIGILFITHDLVLAASRADDVLVLHSGRLVEQLPARHLLEDASMPYTRDLIARVPKPGQALPKPRPLPVLAIEPTSHGCSYAKECALRQDRCATERPPIEELDTEHKVRCWFPIDPAAARAGQEPSEAAAPGTDDIGATRDE
ncbi:MAG: ABC transporter ATP-binding protein [Microbacteriaceae bacterium]|nr:ABC transporter ATP-binding protein [Microbacteriaceae bacterium]